MDPPLHLVCAAVCNYFPCSLEEDEVSERKQEASARQAQVRYRGPFLSSAYPWHSARQSKIVWICEARCRVGLPGPSTSSVTRLDYGADASRRGTLPSRRAIGRSCVAPGRAGPRTAAAEHIRTSSHRARYGNPHRFSSRASRCAPIRREVPPSRRNRGVSSLVYHQSGDTRSPAQIACMPLYLAGRSRSALHYLHGGTLPHACAGLGRDREIRCASARGQRGRGALNSLGLFGTD
jgi:hypothetical protein